MTMSEGMSRRRALQLTGAGVVGAGAFLAGCKKEEPAPAPAPAPAPEKVELTLFDPTGAIEITQLHQPRLDTLDGKTIGFVSDKAWEDERTFALIKELLVAKYPTVTILDQSNFLSGIEEITKDNNGIAEVMQEMGVDAAIIGNAG